MGTTPNYAWPYPEPAATVDVPRDVKALAQAIDTTLFGYTLQFCMAYSNATQPITASPVKAPLTNMWMETPGLATVTGGNLVLNKAGSYLVWMNSQMVTGEATGNLAAAILRVTPTNPALTAFYTELRGAGGLPVIHHGMFMDRYTAGAIFTMDLYGSGMGGSTQAGPFRLGLIRLGP